MKWRAELHERLDHSGWSILDRDRAETWHHTEVWYRWDGRVRVELCLIFDRQGRLFAWSEWHNSRVSIDQETGTRARLDERIGA